MYLYVTVYTKEYGKQELSNYEAIYSRISTFHREDGPALEWSDGTDEWFLDGKNYDKDSYNEAIQEVKDIPEVLRLVDPRWWVREFK